MSFFFSSNFVGWRVCFEDQGICDDDEDGEGVVDSYMGKAHVSGVELD